MTDTIEDFDMETSTERKKTTQFIWLGPRPFPDEIAEQVRECND